MEVLWLGGREEDVEVSLAELADELDDAELPKDVEEECEAVDPARPRGVSLNWNVILFPCSNHRGRGRGSIIDCLTDLIPELRTPDLLLC